MATGGSSRSNRSTKKSSYGSASSSDLGADIDWILKASGSVSRGSAGPVTHNLGVNGASGQMYGSNVSLQSGNGSGDGKVINQFSGYWWKLR